MTPEATVVASPSIPAADLAPVAAALQTIEERTRAITEIAEGLRPLIAFAQQAPALVAVVMDSFDEAVRTANTRGVDVERGLLNGAEAALRFGATMNPERVRELDALLNSGVLAPGTLRVLSELFLVVAPGVALQWSKIPGLAESVGKPGTGVVSNYSYETVASTWEAIRSFRGGTALFTEPLTPVKCGGAPQKIMYLAEEAFRTINREDGIETVTESTNPDVTRLLQTHVASMLARVQEQRPIHQRDPLFAELFRYADRIEATHEVTATGVRVIERSQDAYVVKLLQAHADVVTALIANGRSEMMKNHPLPPRQQQ